MRTILVTVIWMCFILAFITPLTAHGPPEDNEERRMPMIIAPARISLSIGLAGTFHQFDKYGPLVDQVYRADTTGALAGVYANERASKNLAIQLSLRVHLSEYWHIGVVAHHHFMKRAPQFYNSEGRESNYLRLAAIELFYQPYRRKIRPWASIGFASTAIFLKDFQRKALPGSGTLRGVEWGTQARSVSIGLGARHYLAPKNGYDIALRFFPFGSQKIRSIFGSRYSYETLPAGALDHNRINLAMFTLSISFFGTI